MLMVCVYLYEVSIIVSVYGTILISHLASSIEQCDVT